MQWIQAISLALVQGVTEFLPVSSSAHLVIGSYLMGWQDQGLAFDLGIHLGTLGAVLIYFWRDLRDYLGVLLCWHRHPRWREVLLLAVASLPAAVLGVLLAGWVEASLRSLWVIFTANTVFALLLWLADRYSFVKQSTRSFVAMPYGWAVLIGVAQALAFIPGTSRSGVTLSAALLLGLSRSAAARFSFLLSIPVIGGGGMLALADGLGTATPDLAMLLVAMGISLCIALACIGLFMRLIETCSLRVFVAYRLLLSCLLLVLLI